MLLRDILPLLLCLAGGGRAQAPEPTVPLTGVPRPRLAALDRVMRTFMARYGLPGGVLAVARQGRLVYERGFGFADREAGQPVAPDARFRIASLSKPITAVAVLQLVERGKLRLDSRVQALLRPRPLPGAKVDPRLGQVTILQLLQHRGGWNRDAEFDPMFRSHVIAAAVGHRGPATAADVIRYMAGRPLQFEPGRYFCYSNFGYCLLGRVIEKVSGKSYQDYVQAEILRPLGIHRMALGRTRLADRLPGEVRYYGQAWRKARSVFAPTQGLTVPWEYGGFHLEAMDSHGGWVASARDLLRFAADFDDPQRSRLLRPATIATMFARPPGFAGKDDQGQPRAAYYACGWMVTAAGQDHGGSLPGTTAKLVRGRNGVHWVALFNARIGPDGKRVHPDHLQRELQPVLDGIEDWPAGTAWDDQR